MGSEEEDVQTDWDVFEVPADEQDVWHVLRVKTSPVEGWEQLTEAERDVVLAALEARSNAEIAATRGTAKHTVANQLASAFRKLGCTSRLEAATRLAGLEPPETLGTDG